MTGERYDPINLDIGATRKRWSRDPAFAKAYDALADEFAALAELVQGAPAGRHDPSGVANRMGIAASIRRTAGIQRWQSETCPINRDSSSLCRCGGCDLRISLSPKIAPKRSRSRATATG